MFSQSPFEIQRFKSDGYGIKATQDNCRFSSPSLFGCSDGLKNTQKINNVIGYLGFITAGKRKVITPVVMFLLCTYCYLVNQLVLYIYIFSDLNK